MSITDKFEREKNNALILLSVSIQISSVLASSKANQYWKDSNFASNVLNFIHPEKKSRDICVNHPLALILLELFKYAAYF